MADLLRWGGLLTVGGLRSRSYLSPETDEGRLDRAYIRTASAVNSRTSFHVGLDGVPRLSTRIGEKFPESSFRSTPREGAFQRNLLSTPQLARPGSGWHRACTTPRSENQGIRMRTCSQGQQAIHR